MFVNENHLYFCGDPMIAEVLLYLFFVCNAVKWAESEAYWPLHSFKSVIDGWGAHSITSDTILSFDVVHQS